MKKKVRVLLKNHDNHEKVGNPDDGFQLSKLVDFSVMILKIMNLFHVILLSLPFQKEHFQGQFM